MFKLYTLGMMKYNNTYKNQSLVECVAKIYEKLKTNKVFALAYKDT